jgi:hypothetical protein
MIKITSFLICRSQANIAQRDLQKKHFVSAVLVRNWVFSGFLI